MRRFNPESPSIMDAIQDACQEQSSDAALGLLLQGVVLTTRARLGKLYLLSLRDSCFRVEFNAGRGDGDHSFLQQIPLHDLVSGALLTPVSQLLQGISARLTTTATDEEFASPPSGLFVAPVIRSASVLGLIVLEHERGNRFSDRDMQTAETAAAIVTVLLEKRATLGLLQSIQHPIDFFQPFNEFMEELLLLAWLASSMKYVTLRELQPDGKTLKCLGTCGFSAIDKSIFDLTPIENYTTFREAIERGTTQSEPDAGAPHLESIRSMPELPSIRSFVVTPIKVGTAIFGTLSFAAECEYNYSPAELAGFETIASSIGIAINNHRNAERVHEIFAENARVAVAVTALEVAQAARHEARGSIDNAQTLLAHLLTRTSSGKQDRGENGKLIDSIGDSLLEVAKAIDKIRLASQIPKMELRTVSIRELWQQAIITIAGKVNDENVHTYIEGEAKVSAYPEALRLAFLNLLLNSLDAFRDWGKKSSRKITVTIDSRADDAQQIKIRYCDNASGIDPNHLNLPHSLPKSHNPRDLIFELGVTSKENGSGYGLYLVRRILDDHRGSIELVDYRGGVTFDIFLPKYQTISAQAAEK